MYNIFDILARMNNLLGEKNITVSTTPDIGQIMKIGINTIIIQEIIKQYSSFQFSSTDVTMKHKTIYIIKCVFAVLNSIILLVTLKSFLENESLSKINLFKMDWIKYYTKKLYHQQVLFEIIKKNKVWYNNGNRLSITSMTGFFDKFQISLGCRGIYYPLYYEECICIVVTDELITIRGPKTTRIESGLKDFFKNSREIIMGDTTRMYRLKLNVVEMPEFEPIPSYFTIETPTYRHLDKLITENFKISKRLKLQKLPLSVVFDGAAGMGKTTFGMYYANKGRVNLVITVNMVGFAKMKFGDVIELVAKRVKNELDNMKKIKIIKQKFPSL